ncbi:hypothetical protein QOL99_02320 [Deinococcus sp. MIMF12]|uniref:DUF11 domain-containing protein n=1 Tax=Deinococcus rhizophilus TaxID=3049544 RepID=A0ABT7JH26_9DEIO|nr:hypothetical protein [Deinococcus rhizophilus]MDL2342979.1 hypothetical protein [Deinococcus rhizophilus]
MKRLRSSLGLSLLSTAAAVTPVQPAQPVLTMQRVTTTTVAGKSVERLEVTQTTRPGDLLQVSSTLKLTGKEKGARFTVPIPANTTYVSGSARASTGVKVSYALDAKGPFSARPMKKVTVQEDGKTVTREVAAPQNEYRAVRYDLSGVQGTVTVAHRIRVN